MKDDPYLKEMRMSGSVVNADSIAVSKHNTAVRRMAEPLMKKYWKGNVQNLNRIYRVAEYLVKRKSR
tara:strand:- start:840 stop:1040 length:201 start_codon:yes stop_codon:yes gene_type:complete